MRRVEPAYPDLFPLTHLMRPGYLPGSEVSLDPIRMGIVWQGAPRRQLPARKTVPRHPIQAIVFSRVARDRRSTLGTLLERGSSVLMVLDGPEISPADLGLDDACSNSCVTPVLPVLPAPLRGEPEVPEAWQQTRWGVVFGLFPFPGAEADLEHRIRLLHKAGAGFAVAAPMLLTAKDRHLILDGFDGSDIEDPLENALFHADVGRGLHALERRAGVVMHELGMDPILSHVTPPSHKHPTAVRTAALQRMWARRLDQSQEESSWGWRLRRAAAALERLTQDPEVLAKEDNLRVVPGFDPWVESFTRALWYGGEPVESEWRRWSASDRAE